jgi:hypothetical protein
MFSRSLVSHKLYYSLASMADIFFPILISLSFFTLFFVKGYQVDDLTLQGIAMPFIVSQ